MNDEYYNEDDLDFRNDDVLQDDDKYNIVRDTEDAEYPRNSLKMLERMNNELHESKNNIKF